MIDLGILASGSTGNCSLLVLHGRPRPRRILLDAGLAPRTTKARLLAHGVALRDVDEIVLTHLDHDHFHRGWTTAAPKLGISVRVHRRHVRPIVRAGLPVPSLRPFDDEVALAPETTLCAVPLAHDQLGTIGYVVEHRGARLGYATDLGRVPGVLYERFTDLDALAIESNYDRAMQLASGRPAFLQRRIMGGRGHLSNDQALDAVLRIARRSSLRHVALLHLSRDCNAPGIVRGLYRRHAPHLAERLVIADARRPTPLLRIDARGCPARPRAAALVEPTLFDL